MPLAHRARGATPRQLEALARLGLGLGPGAHPRVVEATSLPTVTDDLEGSLTDLPELEWEDSSEAASWRVVMSPAREGRR